MYFITFLNLLFSVGTIGQLGFRFYMIRSDFINGWAIGDIVMSLLTTFISVGILLGVSGAAEGV